MAPPTPIGLFVPPIGITPPVSGIGGSSTPVSNLYDASGNFRNRTGSLKRRRTDEEGYLDAYFDMSQPFPPPNYPSPPTVDVDAVKELLVAAAKERDALKSVSEKCADPNIETIVKSAVSLYNLVEALVERAVIPICQGGASAGSGNRGWQPAAAAKHPPPLSSGEAEMRATLAKADRESIVFDANLGKTAIFNRTKLSAAFSASLKQAVVGAATREDVAESVRVLDDAFSCVEDVDFLGQASKPYENHRDKADPLNGSFYTMPVKLRFPDRDSRIYFENTVRRLKGPKITQSLPAPLRKKIAALTTAVKSENPGKIVMIRPDTRALSLNAFVKSDGDQRWEIVGAPVRLQPADVIPNFRSDSSSGSGSGGEHTSGSGSHTTREQSQNSTSASS